MKPGDDGGIVSLKEYILAIISSDRASHEKALKIASDELARRLEVLNGEASRLAKMQETYYPRQVAEPRLDNIDSRIRELENFKLTLESKASVKDVNIARNISYISLTIALISLILRLIGI